MASVRIQAIVTVPNYSPKRGIDQQFKKSISRRRSISYRLDFHFFQQWRAIRITSAIDPNQLNGSVGGNVVTSEKRKRKRTLVDLLRTIIGPIPGGGPAVAMLLSLAGAKTRDRVAL